MNNTTTLAIFAVLAVMGLVGVVAVTIMSVPEDAEARGCETGISKAGGGYVGLNASKGRCFGH